MISRIIFLFALLVPVAGMGQTNSQWISAGVDGRINDHLRFEIEEGFRVSNTFSVSEITYTDLTLNYRFSKEFRVAGIYRYAQRGNMFNAKNIENRFSFEARYKKKIHHLQLDSRFRYQSRYKDYNSSVDGLVPQQVLRLKLSADYSFSKKMSTGAGTELFWQVTAYYGRGFNSFWLFASFDYNITKQDNIGLKYIWQSHEFNGNNYLNNNVVSLSYTHSFDFSAPDE